MTKGYIQLYVPKELKRKAKIKAIEQDTSVSAVVREALRRWLEEDQPEEQPKKPEK